MSIYNRSLFHIITSLDELPYGKDVYIISDEQYKQLRQSEVNREVQILQNRANDYRKTADLIDEEIKQIQKQAGVKRPAPPNIMSFKQEE
tara:strand:+ start:1134 stop:1403 length:270 start_codon:yes stop_codon:yes gene_type:complete